MKNIVVSAFAPFGAYPVNSSEEALWQLTRIVEMKVIPIIFEASIPLKDRGRELADLALSTGAAAILSLGMASGKRGICIEQLAANSIDNARYCPPELQRTPVCPTHPYGTKLALDLVPWRIDRFQESCAWEGIPVEHSNDAGGFCCNHLAYQTRNALIEREQTTPFLFVHLPCSPEAVPAESEFRAEGKITLPSDLMAQGLAILIRNAQFV